MKVRIEQELYGDGVVILGDLKKFVEAVEAATNDFIHPELQDITIHPFGIVYERDSN